MLCIKRINVLIFGANSRTDHTSATWNRTHYVCEWDLVREKHMLINVIALEREKKWTHNNNREYYMCIFMVNVGKVRYLCVVNIASRAARCLCFSDIVSTLGVQILGCRFIAIIANIWQCLVNNAVKFEFRIVCGHREMNKSCFVVPYSLLCRCVHCTVITHVYMCVVAHRKLV